MIPHLRGAVVVDVPRSEVAESIEALEPIALYRKDGSSLANVTSGPAGPAGPVGPAGTAGAAGATGPAGPAGAAGSGPPPPTFHFETFADVAQMEITGTGYALSGGRAVSAVGTRARLLALGKSLVNSRIIAKGVTDSAGTADFRVVMKQLANGDCVFARRTAINLEIWKAVGGVNTNLVNVTTTGMVASKVYYMVCDVTDDTATLMMPFIDPFTSLPGPDPKVPTASVSLAASGFGAGVSGKIGIEFDTNAVSTWGIDEYTAYNLAA